VQGSWLEQSPTGWLVIGGIFAALGLAIQSRHSSKKKSPAPPADPKAA